MSQNWKTKNKVERMIKNEDYFIWYVKFDVKLWDYVLYFFSVAVLK